MSPLIILGMIIYGVFTISVLISYILLTVAHYEDNVGELLDESKDIFHVCWAIPQMLGRFRFFLLCVMAIMWPISYTFFILLCLPARGATFKEFPLITQRILLWFFLGFGKFTPDPNYVPVREEY